MKLKRVLKDKNVNIKQEKPLIIAGPCSVEDYDTMDKIAAGLKELNIEYLRGGAFKPRTSPYSFQGLKDEGIEILKNIKERYGFKIVSEVLDLRDIEYMIEVVDVLQIGTRNMYNYPLLKEVGQTKKTILLKRAFSATIEEWLNAAEYIALEGNNDIILCERGIRTFETYTRNTLDLNSIPVIKQKTKLKVLVDPSHGTGRRELVRPMSRAAIAAGADGLIIEAHIEPDEAFSDSEQTIDLKELKLIIEETNRIYMCINKN
ncbi:MAG: 3-deoxy-7-phosphoheptulonate synthase [Caloramator sp.]|jgi:3-deoxy-7-phosphoheptulonate synthase|uniref:3-deoxy-7-phosphoheptulonate synthase n=1 Tax=Caloramator sp. TaxID=1871330 RepID=UPI001DD45F03|nr:3-deoxy-7-phosphoheptulonate synthase [Caloramator sp.]MBZ4664064.1 3-deoxy-7-phosphoheptulonate synthase [Caloramator sp.]